MCNVRIQLWEKSANSAVTLRFDVTEHCEFDKEVVREVMKTCLLVCFLFTSFLFSIFARALSLSECRAHNRSAQN